MKYKTVYPTAKLAKEQQSIALANGVTVQPDEVGPIQVPLKTPQVTKNIQHYVDGGYLTMEAPKDVEEQPMTKKELNARAEELGLNWTAKEKKATNEIMEQLIADAESALKDEKGKDDSTENVDTQVK